MQQRGREQKFHANTIPLRRPFRPCRSTRGRDDATGALFSLARGRTIAGVEEKKKRNDRDRGWQERRGDAARVTGSRKARTDKKEKTKAERNGRRMGRARRAKPSILFMNMYGASSELEKLATGYYYQQPGIPKRLWRRARAALA